MPQILKIALAWTGILLLCSNGFALEMKSKFFPYHINYITNDDGLPQNTVNDILLDSYGFVWFGTGNGLTRYDGYSFNIYGKDRLPSNLINSLDVTSGGLLWIGTNKGLGFIDLATGEVGIFRLTEEEEQVGITKVYVDSSDNVWVGTSADGLYQLKENNGKYSVFHYSVVVNEVQNPSINALVLIDENTLLGGTGEGLFSIDIESGVSNKNTLLENDFLNVVMDVRSLYRDAGNTLWIGTFYGLLRFEMGQGTGQWFYPDNQDDNALVHGTVNDITADQFGTIYIGTLGGLEIYDPEISGFIHFPQGGPEDFKLNNNFIRSLLTDNKGNVWVGTEKGGVNHFNLYQKAFYFLTHDVENDHSLSEGPVNSVFRDDEVLWVGTAGGGLNRIGQGENNLRHYRNDPADNSSLSSNFVSALIKDNQDQLWVGTWGAGINKLLKDGSFKRFIADTGDVPNSNYNVFISSFWHDERGFLLVGTEGKLAVLDLSTERITELNSGPLAKINEVGCLLKDRKDYYWVGTRNGLFRFPASMISAGGIVTARDNALLEFYSVSETDTGGSLAGDYVISLTEDKEGNIWAGTYSDGVSCISQTDSGRWKFTNYSTDKGLCNNVVYGILEDQNNNLWMSTDHGLSRFDKETGSFFNFYREDGLLSNQFYWSAAHKSDDGFLYFGNIKGLNYFNPRSFPDYPFRPRVFISGLRVFNKPVKTGEERHNRVVLSRNIYLSDSISLSYRDNVITFEFTAIDYFHPQKIKYAYKLEGVDKQWVEVDSDQRFANYTNLDGGSYQFRVKATNSDGEWNSPEKVITLIIRPPFWQTTWFKILLLIAIVALSIAYARHHTRRLRMQKRTLENMVKERTRQIQEQKDQLSYQALELANTNKALEHRQKLIEGQKNELETKNSKILEQRDRLIELNKKVKAINQSKLRFFTNVSHEFRTPLTLILAPLENLLEDGSLPESVHSSLKTIERNAQRLMMLINQLLTFRKIESDKYSVQAVKGDLFTFLNEIYHAFDGLASDHNIDYISRIDVPHDEFWYDREKLENILYNLLSNAFKFTPFGGQIIFSARVEKENDVSMLYIDVSDTGPGIRESDREKIFDRFYRADELEKAAKGSGIGLALTQELIEALHGRISVENRSGGGASFKVFLPCDGNGFAGDETEKAQSGPVLSDELREKVQVIRDEMSEWNEEEETVVEEPEQKPVVLVVEDNRELGGLIRKSLAPYYKVMEATNGKDAYEMAKDHHFDLVISDIMMPVMDGIELCHQLKNNIYTSHVPVILLSARALVEHQLEGLKTGADDYIPKPFSMKILKARADNLIESRKKLRALFSNNVPQSNEELEAVSSLDRQFMEKAYQVLEDNYPNADFSVESFAGLMFVSRSLLYKKLKALAGLSPNDFITMFRLKKSLDYLRNGAVSVNEVAYKIGFNDPKYFSRVFKKFYRETPSEYLKHCRNQI
ncbi:MAG: hypothetical protein PWQ06_2150 [Anaerophaga sp.]|nr:hypothetical protein [Anaerophaga sp.]